MIYMNYKKDKTKIPIFLKVKKEKRENLQFDKKENHLINFY